MTSVDFYDINRKFLFNYHSTNKHKGHLECIISGLDFNFDAGFALIKFENGDESLRFSLYRIVRDGCGLQIKLIV